MKKNCITIKISIGLLALLVAMPIFVVGASWFFPAPLWAHFSQVLLLDLISSTLVLLIGVGVGVGILGTLLAYWVVMVEFPLRKWLEWLLFLPFAVPAYVLAFVYLGVFDYSGYVQTWMREAWGISGFDIRQGSFAVILTFVLVFYPYVYMLARASFQRQKINLIETGKLLGASPWSVFWKISLPLARPAIAAGVLIVLMETLADFGTVSLFNYDAWTTAIYSAWGDFRSVELAAQLSSLLVLIAFLLIYFEKKARGQSKYYSTNVCNKRPYHAKGIKGWLITLFVSAVLMLAFLMPMLQLIIWAFSAEMQIWSAKYINLIITTATLTAISVLLIVGIATILAFPHRCGNNASLKNMKRLATLGYALPGSVMAVGLMYAVNQISLLNQAFANEGINHLIFGSIGLLLFAYVSRFMAIGYHSIEAGVEQIKPILIDNARLLGATNFDFIGKICLPMMRPAILAAALLVSVDVVKELPATYLLRPFGWDTLAIQVYELSSEGLFELAAAPSLVMVIFAVILMLIFQQLDKKSLNAN